MIRGPHLGFTFQIRFSTRNLWVFVAEIENGFIAFPLKKGGFPDDACFINPGEHPFVEDERVYVKYKDGRIWTHDKWEKMKKRTGDFIKNEPVVEEILERILHGAKITENLEPDIRNQLFPAT